MRRKYQGARGERRAYVACTLQGGWGVSLCTEGQAGHRPLTDYSGPYTVEHAEGIADRLNSRAGLTKAEVVNIVLSTMKPLTGPKKTETKPGKRASLVS